MNHDESTNNAGIQAGDEKKIGFGRYQIGRELGRGGMGVVYQAFDPALKREVALKILQQPVAGSKECSRFARETSLMAKLNHPNIVKVFDMGEEQGRYFFAMELVNGPNFADVLKKNMPLKESVPLLLKVCQAVHYAHTQGVIHRDLKPSNIMIETDGEPKVMDLGLARDLTAEELSQSMDILGTPEYMSPEQAEGKVRQTDAVSDVYSLGAILYEMLAGKPPFTGNNPMAVLFQIATKDPDPPARLNPQVPPELEAICLKALEKEKHKRYASASALASDLRRYLEGRPVVARPANAWVRCRKWVRRHKLVTATASAAVMLAVVAILVYVNALRQEAKRQQQSAQDQTRLAKMAKISEANARISEAKALLMLTKRDIKEQKYLQAGKGHAEANGLLDVVKNIIDEESKRQDSSATQEWHLIRDQYRLLRRAAQDMKNYCLEFFPHRSQYVPWGEPVTPDWQHYWSYPAKSFPLSDDEVRLSDWSKQAKRFIFLNHSQPSLRFVCQMEKKTHTIGIYDLATWQLVRALDVPFAAQITESKDSVVAFSADNRWIAILTQNGEMLVAETTGATIFCQKLESLLSIRDIDDHKKLKFSAHGKWLLAGTNGCALLWQLPVMKKTEIPITGHAIHIAFSRNEKWLAVRSSKKLLISLYDLDKIDNNTKPVREVYGRSVCFGPQDQSIIAADANDICIMPMENSRQENLTIPAAHDGIVNNLELSEDGEVLASTGRDGRLVLWNTCNYSKILDAEVQGRTKYIALTPMPAGNKKVMAFTWDGFNAYSWESSSLLRPGIEAQFSEETRKLFAATKGTSLARNQAMKSVCLAWSAGKNFIAISLGPILYLWNMQTKELHRLASSGPFHIRLEFSSDESTLLWGSLDVTKIWRLQDQKQILLQSSSGDYWWRPHRQSLLCRSRNKARNDNLLLVHIQGEKTVLEKELSITTHLRGQVEVAAWSDDGNRFGIADYWGRVEILEMAGNEVSSLFYRAILDRGNVEAIRFVGDYLLAVGTDSGDFFVYDWRQKKIVLGRDPSEKEQEKGIELNDPIHKIWYDAGEKIFWIRTRNAVYMHPLLTEQEFAFTRHLYPLSVGRGYPIIEAEVAPDASQMLAVLQNGEVVIFPLKKQ